jgi:hybrid cluster-associated redox disulfide protein
MVPTPSLTIAETLARWPATARVFVARRMSCVGCDMNAFETISDAAAAYGIPDQELLRELRRAAPSGGRGDE